MKLARYMMRGQELAGTVHRSGPWRITVPVGGCAQDGSTDGLIKSGSDPVAFTSPFMTLKPGDIVVTQMPVKRSGSVRRPSVLRNRVARKK